MFEIDKAPIAHEITHLLKPHYSSLTYREGLACYMQDEVGLNPSVFNAGEDVFELSKIYWSEKSPINDCNEIIAYLGRSGLPDGLNLSVDSIDTRRAYYILSHSFSKYLIEQYGLESFLIIYHSKDLDTDHLGIYDKNLEALHKEWIDYIQNY